MIKNSIRYRQLKTEFHITAGNEMCYETRKLLWHTCSNDLASCDCIKQGMNFPDHCALWKENWITTVYMLHTHLSSVTHMTTHFRSQIKLITIYSTFERWLRQKQCSDWQWIVRGSRPKLSVCLIKLLSKFSLCWKLDLVQPVINKQRG